jgi:hypothetical protein
MKINFQLGTGGSRLQSKLLRKQRSAPILNKPIIKKRTGEVAQVLECLPSKNEFKPPKKKKEKKRKL